ncbi:MAG: thioredoxin family protein [Acidobacteriota bacterium]
MSSRLLTATLFLALLGAACSKPASEAPAGEGPTGGTTPPTETTSSTPATTPSPTQTTPVKAEPVKVTTGHSPAGGTATEAHWLHDPEKAKQLAKAENKDILLLFTGSDWCPPCKRLEREVFKKPEFAQYASEKLVLVELDFPRRKQLPLEDRKRNDLWKRHYGVSSFPTVLMTDTDLRAYAKTGFRAGGPANYQKHLDALIETRVLRDRLLTRADSATGLERARLIDQAIESLPRGMPRHSHGDLVDEILDLDPGVAGELRSKHLLARRRSQIEGHMAAKQLDDARLLIDDLLAELAPTGDVAQELFYMRAQTNLMVGDTEEAIFDLEAALAEKPEGPKARMIQRLLERHAG